MKSDIITDPDLLQDITGFEIYLRDLGWDLYATSKYFNTYNGCARAWRKDSKSIVVGLVGTVTRVGIYHPTIIELKGDVPDYKYTFLPEADQYDEWIGRLTKFQ
jgi:hypothetical protein